MYDISILVADGYNIRNAFPDNSIGTAKAPCLVDKRTKEHKHHRDGYANKTDEYFKNTLVIHESCAYVIKNGRQDNGRYIICLDWDIYQPETGVDCEKTSGLLGTYENLCGENDGMFNSSTDGNMGTLLDITDCDELVRMCECSVESFKPAGYQLEVQVTKHQCIPPSMTPCKKTGKMGKRREFTREPFKVIRPDDGNIYEFVKQLLRKAPKKPTPGRIVTPPPSDIENDSADPKYIDMIMNGIGGKLANNQYLRLASVLKYNNYEFSVFDDWVRGVYQKQRGAHIDDTHESLWETCLDTITEPQNMTFIDGLSKQYNPEYYAEFCKTRTSELRLDKSGIDKICAQIKMDEPKEAELNITLNELLDVNLCADVITKTLKDTLCFTGDCWCELDSNNLWRMTKEPTYKVTKTVRAYIDYSNGLITRQILVEHDEEKKQKLREKSASFTGQYIAINKTSWNSVLQKTLKTTLYDADFIKKLNQNVGYLVFKNGVLCLETGKFRAGVRWDDFVTRTLPYDYEQCDKSKKNWLLEKLKQILNNDASDLEYFLCWLGYSFIGKAHLEKSMLFMIDGTDGGKGNNGKTLIFDSLYSILPTYVYKSSGSLLEDGNMKTHKQLALMDGIRLLFIEEFSKTKRLNTELMKELSDGRTKENEVLFGTMNKINVLFKTFVLSNNQITVAEGNEAVYNRWIQMKFGSHFGSIDDVDRLEFVADKGLTDAIRDDYKYEMIDIILEYAMKYFRNGMPKQTEKVIAALNEQKCSQSEMYDWIEQNCVKGKDFRLSHVTLLATNTVCGNDKELKMKMKALGYKYQCHLNGMGKNSDGSYIVGGYNGLKMLE